LSPFVDSGIWIGAKLAKDDFHASAKQLLDEALHGREQLYISTWVMDEVVSYFTKKKPALASDILESMQTDGKIRILPVDRDIESTAKSLVEEHSKSELALSMTDWTSVLLLKKHKIGKIITTDAHFQDVKRLPEYRFFEVVRALREDGRL
jgi:predicted nucleic acid-binding protein